MPEQVMDIHSVRTLEGRLASSEVERSAHGFGWEYVSLNGPESGAGLASESCIQ